jgi:Ca2+-binding RTX toxin-like protein
MNTNLKNYLSENIALFNLNPMSTILNPTRPASSVDVGDGLIIQGTSRNNRLNGSDGNDTITTRRGRDSIDGGEGNDYIDAGTNKDFVRGGLGRDTLLGGKGADTLFGGSGNDIIDGGTDKDIINGGKGADIMTGGRDRDQFVFDFADIAPGVIDEITDFKAGTDDIIIQGAGPGATVEYDAITGEVKLNGQVFLQLDPGLNININNDFTLN